MTGKEYSRLRQTRSTEQEVEEDACTEGVTLGSSSKVGVFVVRSHYFRSDVSRSAASSVEIGRRIFFGC